jgi:Flp pilus assembly secretin CpaC
MAPSAPTTPVTPADTSDDASSDASDSDSDSSESSTASATPAVIDQNGMVIIDVTIIRSQENHTTAKGVNLLNGLTLQFGDESGTGTAGFSAIDTISKVVGSNTKTITRAINIPAITYSMNIANVNDTRNEILARPTLTATNGSESKFFSGVHIQAAVMPSTTDGSGGSGVTFDDEVGVKLSVTPTLLDDGRVKMDVSAERKFLNTPDSSYTGFTSKLESSRTTVSATVAMHFGETLILSGLSEKETEKIRDGVPLLQDIPVIQYLFSRKTTKDFTKSVMILLTPRQPQYTYRNAKATGPRAGQNPALSELRARHMDWFNPYATAETIFNHLQSNPYYRELRTGDVTLERWEDYSGFYSRLTNAIGFLYY